MMINTQTVDNNRTRLTVDFMDEGVDLTGTMLVAGDESAALAYAHFFEADLRRNNAELFPVVEMSAEGIPDEIGGVE